MLSSSEPAAAGQPNSFLLLLTVFCFVQLDIFMNSLNCQEEDSPLTTVRLLSGIQDFVALCASIFVEIQKVWVRIDGLFWDDVFF